MEKDTQLSLNRLFHYTHSLENLVGILTHGFQIRYSLEKLGLFEETISITDEFAFPVVCFCDIPLNLVNQHIKVYGKYAIGLSKTWGEQQAMCPIFYLPKEAESKIILESIAKNIHGNSVHLRDIFNSLSGTNNKKVISQVINLYDQLIDLMMFIKPYMGYYERKSTGFKESNYKFYDEREWRYKPNRFLITKSYLTKEEFLDYKRDASRNEGVGFIDFSSDDITDIIVPADEVEKVIRELLKIDKLKDFKFKITTFTIEADRLAVISKI